MKDQIQNVWAANDINGLFDEANAVGLRVLRMAESMEEKLKATSTAEEADRESNDHLMFLLELAANRWASQHTLKECLELKSFLWSLCSVLAHRTHEVHAEEIAELCQNGVQGLVDKLYGEEGENNDD